MPGIPISVGIVGHRDIPAALHEGLVGDIKLVLRQYRDSHPQTPIVLLSALAAGADQIAVKAARLVKGVSVIAVLPMPVEDYRRDFLYPQERSCFDSLLADADGLFVVSDHWPDQERLGASFEPPGIRDLAYQRCARFISLYSHVLIAVWDGGEPKLIGGTADTVYHRIPGHEGLTASHHAEFPAGRPPETTIHLPVIRESGQRPARLISGANAQDGAFRLTGGQTYEPWAMDVTDPLVQALEELNENLFTNQASGDRDSEIVSLMNAADSVAGRLQRSFRRVAAGLLTLSVVGLVLISLVQNVSTSWLLFFSLVAIGCVGVLWWRLARSQLKQRFQQFRVLAEGARVQEVWDDVALGRCVAEVYLAHQPEFRWIRTILRTAWLVDNSRNTPSPTQPLRDESRAREAAHDWIEDQTKYFLGDGQRIGALERNQKKARAFLRLGLVGIVIAIVGVMPGALQSVGIVQSPDWASVAGQSLWALGLGLVAASAAYSELMAFRDVSRRYVQSIQIFQDGLARLGRIEAVGDAESRIRGCRKVVDEVGTEALQETSAWFATSYDRKVRPV